MLRKPEYGAASRLGSAAVALFRLAPGYLDRNGTRLGWAVLKLGLSAPLNEAATMLPALFGCLAAAMISGAGKISLSNDKTRG